MFHSEFAKYPRDRRERRRYRHAVLEKGGAQDEMVTLTQFLGRQPGMERFYRSLGLVKVRRVFVCLEEICGNDVFLGVAFFSSHLLCW
jgi:hypothetical protein